LPRVSVIVPAHNAAATLPETLGSLAGQTFADWEAVVVDDCSEDGTERAARGVDARIRVLRSAANLGPAGARNLAIELLALLDADDLWLPNYLAEQVALYDRALAEGRRAGIVACDAYLLSGERRLPRTYAETVGSPAGIGVGRLLRENPIYVSAMFPRALFDEVGPFSSECFGSEDHDLWLRIVETGREVVFNPRPLAVYRLRSESVSANAAGMARTGQATYRLALERGRLGRRQRVIARRELRLQRAVERAQGIAEAWRLGRRGEAARLAGRSLALFGVVALERPGRWSRWLRAARGGAVTPIERARRAAR
jgi:glycosyltransferase involved in cell wall biosynthesis